ncbi:RabGAP/TBC [Viridothelium virens]|uniref:GTPase-activating protein GYP5 n=1 Tax=Viridothelium virens TaxID=1048519 RepID=A0A6A6H5U3_VIRVR|nr:RabGAP/TBC [Viridothelium virens]
MDRADSTQSSDRENDTFEDAHDTTSTSTSRAQSPASRSLISGRRGSSSSTTRHSREPSRLRLSLNGDSVEDTEDQYTNGDRSLEESVKDMDETPADLKTEGQIAGSPPLTAKSFSMESMQSVPLNSGKSTAGTDKGAGWPLSSPSTSSPNNPAKEPPKLPPREPSSSRIQGLSQKFENSYPPPPSAPLKPQPSPSQPAAPSRKFTTPFAWFSRNSDTGDKRTASPPLPSEKNHERRGTTSSVATMGSNPEVTVSKGENGQEGTGGQNRANRTSLKDRFKLLRMQEEAGIDTFNEDGSPKNIENGEITGTRQRSGSVVNPGRSPKMTNGEKDGETSAPSMARNASSPGRLPRRGTINSSLLPGTAAGIAEGPAAEDAEPVDWDLWQSVVYEGPAAVARTSADELNHAIASGIPQAIRGVVWQVLAQSKNDDLEDVYRELSSRTVDNNQVVVNGRKTSNPSVNGTKEKDSHTSSASSIRSGSSTPATSTMTGSPPPSNDSNNAESVAKLQASLAAENRKKTKDDAAALVKLEKTIKRDMGARTSFSKYLMSAGLQDGLFNVCKAYALFDEGVGYAQGINFISMPLLFNMPEEEAFCLLVRLMNNYHLRDLFIQDMPGLHLHLYQFERLLEDFEPALCCHLNRRGVKPELYATQWFLTLFAYRFPLQLVLRVYDLILSDGLEGAILKFGIVLMQKNTSTLMQMKEMSTLTTFLKERIFDVYIDKAPSANSLLESGFFGSAGGIDKEVYRANELVQDACSVNITTEMLKQYAAEWEELQRAAREREAELEGLRGSNASLSLKVRGLEERVEKNDTEHVQIASDLVRTKVDNEQLADDNESLRGQVEELRKLVEKQPEEVEERLKSEMERIMARNMEVQNENRALEEQMAEMEKDLVETKMGYAQLNAEFEDMKQRWSSLQSMLNNPAKKSPT